MSHLDEHVSVAADRQAHRHHHPVRYHDVAASPEVAAIPTDDRLSAAHDRRARKRIPERGASFRCAAMATETTRPSAVVAGPTTHVAPDSTPTRKTSARIRKLGSLGSNSISIMGTSVVNAGLGYAYWTFAARIMPANAVGLGSALVSTMVILSLLVHLGAGAGLVARLPQRENREQWLLTVVAVLAASSAATVVLAAAAVYPLGLAVPPLRVLAQNPALAAWFVVGAVGWTSSDLLDWVFIAERRGGLMVVRNAATALTKLTALVCIAVAFPSIGAFGLVATWALSALLGTAVGLLACHRWVRRLGRVPIRNMTGELAALARPVLGNHLISVCGLVPTYLLPLVVTAQLGTDQNAYFYVTWMVGSAVFMISPAVSAALFAEGSHDPSRLRRLSLNSLLITLALLAGPAAIVISGGHMILNMFGPGYGTGFVLLTVLVLSAFPDAVSNIAVATLRIRGKLWRGSFLNGMIASVALVGAWFATPHFGILGAGLAWLGAQICGALGVAVFRRSLLPSPEARGRHRRAREVGGLETTQTRRLIRRAQKERTG
jgi:O-antigen/teichoic acid export membrane protein